MRLENLKNKYAFITGSCEGIGFAVAKKLAAGGCKVIIHDKSHGEKCVEAMTEIDPSGELCNSFLLGDLGDQEMLNNMLSKLEKVDILILNASTQKRVVFEELSKELFNEQVDTNFWSSIALIQHVLPHMKANGWGRIITLGSVQEVKPHAEMAIYAGLKAAVANLVKNLALQYGRFNITVNNVAPGVIRTSRNVEALSDAKYRNEVLAKIPLGNFGNSEDCAGIISLLASESGKYITGQTIYCDGGMSL